MRDTSLILKDAGAVTASGYGTVDSEAKVIDLGTGLVEGNFVVNLTAAEKDSDDEKYELMLEACNSPSFDGECAILAGHTIGAADLLPDYEHAIILPGNHIAPFTNYATSRTDQAEGAADPIRKNITFRYVRLKITVSGTVVTGIDFSAFLTRR